MLFRSQKKILESKQYAQIMEKLVMCAIDVPVPLELPAITDFQIQREVISDLQKKYGLGTSIDRMLVALDKR